MVLAALRQIRPGHPISRLRMTIRYRNRVGVFSPHVRTPRPPRMPGFTLKARGAIEVEIPAPSVGELTTGLLPAAKVLPTGVYEGVTDGSRRHTSTRTNAAKPLCCRQIGRRQEDCLTTEAS